MTRSFAARTVLALLAVVLVPACTATPPLVSAQRTDVLEVPAEAVLRIDNAVGEIVVDVRPDAETVRAEVVRIARAIDESAAEALLPEVEATLERDAAAGTVVATGRVPKGSSRRQGSIRWHLVVPPGATIDARCAVGAVSVAGDGGDVVVRVDVGEVTVRGRRDRVEVTTDVGEIDVEADAHVVARSDVGEIRAALRRAAGGSVTANTDVGEIAIVLPAGWSGTIDADSGVGGVSSSLGAGASSASSRRLRTSVGEGPGRVEADAGVGEVRIERAGA